MSGHWVFVCGPSGAGKDSVMAWARDQLAGDPGVVFSQRFVTRSAAAGADHQGLEELQFEQLKRRGALAWNWEAHGFQYGIAGRYAQQVAWGRVVVVNGSRAHVAALADRTGLHVVEIAAHPEAIAVRLARRGRDAPEAVVQRLERNARLARVQGARVISNDGALAVAGQQLVDYLAGLSDRQMA